MGALIIVLIMLIVLALILAIWLVHISNSIKAREIKVEESLSGIEVALTKRYDMLTKLMDTARGYLVHERGLLTQVVQLRRGMNVQELQQADKRIGDLSRQIFAVAENYPELRSSEIFVELQRGIREAEEHLQAARRVYNANVSAYNTAITIFPNHLLAGGRQQKEFFEAEAHKRADVKISF